MTSHASVSGFARRASRLLAAGAVALLVLAAPNAASAQLELTEGGDWSLWVTPRIGFLQAGEAGVLPGWQPEGLRIRGGPVAGLAIELQTPVDWFSLRATVEQSARNNLSFRGNAPDLATPDPLFLSRASALQSQVSLGGVVRVLRSFPVSPSAVFGVGVRHWDFDPANLAQSLVPRFPESRWDDTHHYGVGVDVDARPFGLRFEVIEYVAETEVADLGATRVEDRFLMLTFQWTGFGEGRGSR